MTANDVFDFRKLVIANLVARGRAQSEVNRDAGNGTRVAHGIGTKATDVGIVTRTVTTDDFVVACAGIHKIVSIATLQFVVAITARKLVVTTTTLQFVSAVVRPYNVVESVTCSLGGPSAEVEIFDVVRHDVVDHCNHGINPVAIDFRDYVAQVIDDINVVTCTARECVGPGTAGQRIAPGTPEQRVRPQTAAQQIIPGLAIEHIALVIGFQSVAKRIA